MRIPLSWIREFASIPAEITPAQISDAFVRVGFEVEEVIHLGSDLSGPLVVGSVLAIEELVGHKKPIRWVELDCGEHESRFVICGATNFRVGDLVVVALPGAVLPGNFAISQRETYGRVSDGMICSSREMGLGQDHDGIYVLPGASAKVGDDAIELLEISDVVFDIAINPDRGYAMSLRGISREIAAALDVPYEDPAKRVNTGQFPATGEGISVSITDPTGASVIYIRTLEEFNFASQSPLWMKRRIEKCGMRPISLAVDVTNYVMLELGQPLHAFDKNKISGALHIRRAGSLQSFTTLDGQVRTLDPEDLVVADDTSILALAGTMGGESSEVNFETNGIAIEAARFDPISVAKNARRHKLSSEASRRFERGVDPNLAEIASARAVELLTTLSGARYVGSESAGDPVFPKPVHLNPNFPAILTGATIASETVLEKLTVVGCKVEKESDSTWVVTPASWRSDLETPSDLVEEVARMIGYDSIPSALPNRPVSPGLTDSQLRRRLIANHLAARGLVEVQMYPFVSEQSMKTLGYTGDRAAAFRIANPMSEDAPLLRTHLIPGLAEAALRNLGRGARNFGLFEIGSIFRDIRPLSAIANPKTDTRPSREQIEAIYQGVPDQPIHVGAILIGQMEPADWRGKGRLYEWSDAIALAESIIESCNFTWTVSRSDFAPWHPGRCAELLVDGKVVAHAGELHPRIVTELGLPPRACAFVVNLDALGPKDTIKARPLGSMPVAVQDIALIVDAEIPAAIVLEALRFGAGELLESIHLFDRYDQLGEGKVSLAFTLTFRAPDRTLTSAEVSTMRESACEVAFAKTGAVVRSA